MEMGDGVSHLTGAGNSHARCDTASLAATLIHGTTGVPRQDGKRLAIVENEAVTGLNPASYRWL